MDVALLNPSDCLITDLSEISRGMFTFTVTFVAVKTPAVTGSLAHT